MTNLGSVFVELNRLEQEGVIKKYAVAGGMAFLFYTDPVNTYDLDIFIYLPQQCGKIINMSPLYAELTKRGYTLEAEHVIISNVVVQFIIAYNPLAEESLDEAQILDYDGIPVRVISAEHLVALAYQTGGAKRRERVQAMLDEEDIVNVDKLMAVLSTHGVSTGKIDG